MSDALALSINQLPVNSLTTYIDRVFRVPLLTLEEEQSLTNDFYKTGSLEAARKLVVSHLRFVVKIAKGYVGYGLPEADLIQEGNIGLMKAVKRFDPTVGVRLVTFAVHWIKSEIHDYVIRNWRIVKVATTKAQRKLFFNLKKFSKQNQWLTKAEATDIASELGVPTRDVLEMEKRLLLADAAFDPLPADSEQEFNPSQALPDMRTAADPLATLEAENWAHFSKAALAKALQTLSPREIDIIKCRQIAEPKVPLKTLAEKYNISMERVRQLENQILAKLRKSLSDL